MDGANGADGIGAEKFDEAQVPRVLVVLGSHLGSDPFLFCELGHKSSFCNGMGKRLFAVNVQAAAQSANGGGCMVMIGGSDHDGVQVSLFEEESIVSVFLGVGETIPSTIESIPIDIADRDDIFGSDGIEITSTSTANTDCTDVQTVVSTEDTAIGPSGRVYGTETTSDGSLKEMTA